MAHEGPLGAWPTVLLWLCQGGLGRSPPCRRPQCSSRDHMCWGQQLSCPQGVQAHVWVQAGLCGQEMEGS